MHATSHDGGTIRAASLVRVSTKGQADKGLSLDEQDRRVAKYISDQEWTPAGEYREPGVSGKRKDRPELDRLLADAEARLFDRVVVAKLDRLGRNVASTDRSRRSPMTSSCRITCLARTSGLRRRVRFFGEQAVAVDDGGGEVNDLAVGGA